MATINYLVLGGGGGGGSGLGADNGAGGGGGGGAMITGSWSPSGFNSYSVTIGAGGKGHDNVSGAAAGGSSSFNGSDTGTKLAGGGGIGGDLAFNGGTGTNSGPGGGGGGQGGTGGGTNPTKGGNGADITATAAAGGGAGAGGNGGNGVGNTSSNTGGAGGAGSNSSISGGLATYGGGGGGGAWGSSGAVQGGGGSGAVSGTSTAAVAGTNGQGGGGGGGVQVNSSTFLYGASGGSGAVIFSYTTGTLTATGGTITTSGGNTIHTFTAGGTFQITGVSINASGAALTLSGGTPVVFSNSPIIFPNAASLVLGPGSPVITSTRQPPGASLSLIGGNPSLVRMKLGVPYVTIGGVDHTNDIEWDTPIGRDVLNQSSTFGFVTINGYHPAEGSAITFWRDGAPIFTGAITMTQQTYTGQNPTPLNIQYNVSCVDGAFFVRKRLPYGVYTNVSATFVVQDIVSKYSTYGTNGLQANLPNISITFDGSNDLDTCLTNVCKLIGGNHYTGADGNIYLFTPDGAPFAPGIDDTTTTILSEPPMAVTQDYTQIRSRVNVKGAVAASLAGDVGANETIVPVTDTSVLSSGGGSVFITPASIIPYTGIQTNKVGSITGPGVSPTQSPTVSLVKGTGLGIGNYQYAEVFVTAQGKSTPGPVASITTVGVTTIPDPTVALSVNQYDNYGNYSGTAPNYNAGGNGPHIGDTVQYSYSWSTSSTPDLLHDTNLAPATPVATVRAVNPAAIPAGWTVACAPFVTGGVGAPFITPILAGDINYLHVWRKLNGGSWTLLFTITAISAYTNGIVFADANGAVGGSPPAPNATVAAKQQVSVTPFTGPTGTTSREIYRTAVGGSQLLLVHTYSDNVSVVPFVDSTGDGSLGAAAPTGDTSGLPFNISNGGGFYTSGVTFPTDGAATGGLTASPVFTSASYNFVAADVGAYIYIASGTNWIPGRYLITSVASNAATVAGPIATTASPTAATWGIDYSTLTNARISFTDMVIDASTATKFTSALNPVGVNFIGNVVAVNNSIGFISQRVIVKSTASTVATCDKNLGTLSSTGGSGNLGGAPPPTSTPAGSTSIQVRDISQFPATGGWVSDNNQQIRYTGIQTVQAQSSLTGIPTSGPGSISTAINFGTNLVQLQSITGCQNVSAVPKGTPVRLYVVVDNLTAQAALATITGTDGVFESVIDDSSLATIASCVSAANADMTTFSTAIVTVEFAIRNTSYHSGKKVTIARTNPPVAGTFTIQDVTISQLWATPTPLYTVKCSNMKFTLQDLLAQVVNLIQSGGTV